MRRSILIVVAAVLLLSTVTYAQSGTTLKTKKDSLSYALGAQIGKDFLRNNMEIDPAVFDAAFRNSFSGKDLLMNEEAIQNVIMAFQQELQEKMMKEKEESMSKNVELGEKFLKENATKPGVKVTASGLQYKVMKEGTGKTPSISDKVKVHYEGTLIDGTIFDSSFERNQPIEFPVTGVIKGWTEGLQLMKEGGEFMLYIPADLAYGDRGAGEQIGPGSTIIFKVQLIAVTPNAVAPENK
ncbi:MAG: hypothetical protein A2X64_01670 [Ignavibacteria bacterium GWF2_33_9]|nr:MAG: hypothetical protein A2X64_01670 [Ignavibacteria bacterium GWF2_33_9]